MKVETGKRLTFTSDELTALKKTINLFYEVAAELGDDYHIDTNGGAISSAEIFETIDFIETFYDWAKEK